MNRSSANRLLFAVLAAVLVVSLVADIAFGSVNLPLSEIIDAITGKNSHSMTSRIITDVRLPKAICALLTGIALSVSGLQMQTIFRNPLAGPYVLGISSGASLGVALFILGTPFLSAGTYSALSSWGTAGAAWIGAASVLLVIAAVGSRVRDIMVLLILGMMFSSGVSAVVQILQYLSSDEALKAFVIWTMGTLGEVSGTSLAVLCGAVVCGTLLSVAAIKPLNLMLLGEDYARSAGVNPRSCRLIVFASTTLLAGTVTAFCGPIGFIGLAVPHVVRAMTRCADNRILLPATILTGGSVMLLCDLLSKLFAIPVNSITALLGIPVVVWVVVRSRSFTV